MANPPLPNALSEVVDANRRPTIPWNNWFRAVNAALNAGTISDEELSAAIAKIVASLGSTDGTADTIFDVSATNFIGFDPVLVNGGIGGNVFVRLTEEFKRKTAERLVPVSLSDDLPESWPGAKGEKGEKGDAIAVTAISLQDFDPGEAWPAAAPAVSQTGITDLTGDVTATGPGSAAATIANDAVSNAKLANMAAHTLKANITGSSADPVDSSLSAILDAEVGSSTGMLLRRGASSWDSLAYPNDNTKFLDGTGAYSNPAATGGAGYATALDLDFTAESSQTLTTDGNYTIGGLTWTKVNSAADATAMAVTNGTGLVIQPVQTSNYNGTTRTAPYIYTDVVTLIPSWYLGLPLRISIYFSADTISASGHSGGVSLDNLSTSTNTTCIYTLRRANNSGTKSNELGGTVTGTTITFTANTSNLDSTDRVLVMDLPAGRFNGMASVYEGAYSGGFPALNTMRARQRNPSGNNSYTVTQDIVTSLPMKIALFAQRNGSATTLSVTIARLKIEYRVS